MSGETFMCRLIFEKHHISYMKKSVSVRDLRQRTRRDSLAARLLVTHTVSATPSSFSVLFILTQELESLNWKKLKSESWHGGGAQYGPNVPPPDDLAHAGSIPIVCCKPSSVQAENAAARPSAPSPRGSQRGVQKGRERQRREGRSVLM